MKIFGRKHKEPREFDREPTPLTQKKAKEFTETHIIDYLEKYDIGTEIELNDGWRRKLTIKILSKEMKKFNDVLKEHRK